jgi:hypothetical protein
MTPDEQAESDKSNNEQALVTIVELRLRLKAMEEKNRALEAGLVQADRSMSFARRQIQAMSTEMKAQDAQILKLRKVEVLRELDVVRLAPARREGRSDLGS